MDKEVWLTGYFAEHLKGEVDICVPKTFDRWTTDSSSFGIFEWCKMTDIGMVHCHSTKRRFLQWKRMMSLLRQIKPPVWWDPRQYLWIDYAGPDNHWGPDHEESPFGIDFDDNVAFLPNGSLLIFDFEHIQWVPFGLQDCYIALKALCSSSRHVAFTFARCGRIYELWHELPNVHDAIIEKAEEIYCTQLRKRNLLTRLMRLRTQASALLLKRR